MKREEYLKKEILEEEKLLRRYPSGELYVTKNRNTSNWYLKKEDGEQIKQLYLSKTKRTQAENYAYKKYIECKLQDLKKELEAIRAYLKKYNNYQKKSEKLLKDEKYHELLKGKFNSPNEILQQWKNKNYEKCSKYPENLIHKCISGNIVRSKSEELIDTALFQNGIAYRYECPLEIKGKIVYPDFTIMKNKSLEIVYWEHFGMMDDDKYKYDTIQKIKMYVENGIFPFENLIITYETKVKPLVFQDVLAIIKMYL